MTIFDSIKWNTTFFVHVPQDRWSRNIPFQTRTLWRSTLGTCPTCLWTSFKSTGSKWRWGICWIWQQRGTELICTRTLTFFMIFNFVASIAFSFLLFTFVPGWYIVLHERFTFDIIKNMTSFYLTFYVLVYTTILFFIYLRALPSTH